MSKYDASQCMNFGSCDCPYVVVGSAKYGDPIAEKLGVQKGGSQKKEKYCQDYVPWGTSREDAAWEEGQKSDQAFYPVYEFRHTDDDTVMALMELLGINALTTERATIVLEQGKPVRITTEGYSLASETPIIFGGASFKRPSDYQEGEE